MKQLHTAIIGFGLGGQVFHAPILHMLEGFTIQKIMTSSAHNINHAIQQYPATEIISTFEDALSDDIDLIVLASPNQVHYQQAKLALKSGKHVVVDKPFTVTSEQAKELIVLSKEVGKIISVHQSRRWDSDFLTLKKILKLEDFGDVVSLESNYNVFKSEVGKKPWKETLESDGGGTLYDLGSHLIDQSLQLFGKPKSIFAHFKPQRNNAIATDFFQLILFYNGFEVKLNSSFLVTGKIPRYIAIGTKGNFVKYSMDVQEAELKAGKIPNKTSQWGKEPENNSGILTTIKNGKIEEKTIATALGNYPVFYKNIYEAIVEGKHLLVKPEEALLVIQLIEAAIKSNRLKQIIDL
ncbi:Gfo/Idh/MocA family oxidoreductase [Zhouia sp. PK063]|uniref:Gfo/Idh/MocA family oxidoreductase n=1 Tax=Zhouia sp. PK063 TaxID=3373602 RepID=UPI0037A0AADB